MALASVPAVSLDLNFECDCHRGSHFNLDLRHYHKIASVATTRQSPTQRRQSSTIPLHSGLDISHHFQQFVPSAIVLAS